MLRTRIVIAFWGCVAALMVGCRSHEPFQADTNPLGPHQHFVQQIEYTDAACLNNHTPDILGSPPPASIRRPEETEKWPLTLEEALRIAIANSQVIRGGGTVLAAGDAARTVFDPALAEASPLNGTQAALSAFDAQLTSRLFLEQTDRLFNNIFFGAGAAGLLSNTADYQLGVTKTAATGTQFTLENLINYNRNNSRANLFPSVYDTTVQGGFRHPLLQGGGVEYNRIAGPNGQPGSYNGILLARINSDVSIVDFELAVRGLARQVVDTYWDLYFAYRDLEVKRQGRQLALESWELEKRRAEAGIRTFDQEAFARQQYYQAEIAVENALTGTVQGTAGVYAVERQLRSLMGLPTTDGRMIVPAEEPETVDVRFDWNESMAFALTRRPELRRQQWQVKRRELELVASRNFTKMRLDLIGQYRWRGFGDDLFGGGSSSTVSAFHNLMSGDLQDWRFGLDFRTPVGNRIGHAAVRHAELQLARARAIYEQIERDSATELNASFTELDRAFVVTRSNYNLRIATLIRLEAERQRNEKGRTDLDLVLDAQRQAVTAESQYHQSLVAYQKALVAVHVSRGTLLDYLQVNLAEGPWVSDAHASAAKVSRTFMIRDIDYGLSTTPPPFSRGAYPQVLDEGRDAAISLDENPIPVVEDDNEPSP